MGSRDHATTCDVCGLERGGLNDYKCHCDIEREGGNHRDHGSGPIKAKCYAKKRESVRAVQWLGGEKTAELTELFGQRGHVNAETGQLELGSGWYARPSDWIFSASGEDLSVISDEVFRKIYEEVDETGRVVPTDDEHEVAGREFVRELDVLLGAGLKLSLKNHPAIFRDRDRLVRTLRQLFEDRAWTAERRERQRVREKIVKELAP